MSRIARHLEICFLLVGVITLCACQEPRPVRGGYERHASARSRHNDSIARIKQLGGQVFPERGGSAVVLHNGDAAATDEVLNAARHLTDLGSISLIDCRPPEGWVERFRGKPHLTYLALSGVELSLSDIASFAGLPKLEAVHLIDTGLTDAGVVALAHYAPNLKELTIAHDGVTDSGAIWLSQFKQLRTLRLVGTQIGAEQVADLVAKIPRLIVHHGDGEDLLKGVWSGR